MFWAFPVSSHDSLIVEMDKQCREKRFTIGKALISEKKLNDFKAVRQGKTQVHNHRREGGSAFLKSPGF